MEIQSVVRALRLIEELARGPGPHTVTALARALGTDKSTVSRLLGTLVGQGFAERDEASRGYVLGPALIALGQRALRRIDVRLVARPHLERLVAETGECAHLAILVQDRALYVEQVAAGGTVNVDAPVGTLAPLHCTALGKAMLAFQPAETLRAMAERLELEGHTRRTITRWDHLHDHLAEVRARGIAFDDEEFSVGVRCIAAPVLNHAGAVAAAIGISGPSPRVTDDRFARWAATIRESATALSAHLGHEPEDRPSADDGGTAGDTAAPSSEPRARRAGATAFARGEKA